MTVPDRAALLANLRRGTLEYCVLAHLRRGQAYGLEITRALGRDGVLVESEGTLYPLLSRLRRTGWVTTWTENPIGGTPRRYYALTGSGVAALSAFEALWQQFSATVDGVLTGIAT